MFSPPSLTILAGSALAVFYVSAAGDCPPFAATAFSFSNLVSKQAKRSVPIGELLEPSSSTTTQLGLSTTTTTPARSTEDAIEIYEQAREFAFRYDFGDCDNEYDKHYHSLDDERKEIEESKFWMRKIVEIESGCATGTLAGKDLCENQDRAAETVARLRQKIQIHERRVVSRTKVSDSVVPTIATELILGAILVVVALFWITLDVVQRHDDIPSLENYLQFKSILEEKGYEISLLGGSGR
jgi:hypothetical protein